MKLKKLIATIGVSIIALSPIVNHEAYAVTSGPSKSIIGVDNRTQVMDTTKNPYQSIVSLVQTYGSSQYVCTGTVIAKNKVITAAHCLYDAQKGGYPDKVTLAPGRNNDKLPFGEFEATYAYVPSQWSNYSNTNYDIAILDVAQNDSGQDIGDVVQQQQLEMTSNFINKDITITGYPGDKMQTYGITQWTHRDLVKSQSGNKFSYDVDTMGGQSGSAVFNNATGKIIGIHTNGGYTNSATQINSEIYNWIQSHM